MTAARFFFADDGYLPADAAAVSPFAPAFLYGHGVFETLRLYRGRPHLLADHQRRLAAGLEFLGLARPAAWDEIPAIIDALAGRNGLEGGDAMVRLVCGGTPPGNEPGAETPPAGLIVQVLPLDLEAIAARQAGCRTCILPWRRDPENPLLRHKTLNYLENYRGRRLAARQGCQEGLFLNCYQELCEGTYSNLFLVEEDSLVTPPVSAGLLPGITRAAIIRAAGRLGIACREERLTPELAACFQGGFLTSSLMELAPLVNLERQQFQPSRVADLGRALVAAYRRLE
ncbi:MAG: aminotransferase class IV [Deltaproteobacteria bacterium]|nr:aminotransferase class IV [Deltaproteobacteria bacterium]